MTKTLLAMLCCLGACVVGDQEPIDPVEEPTTLASEDSDEAGKVCQSIILGSADDACESCTADLCSAAGCGGAFSCKSAGPYGKKCVCESSGPLEQ